MDLVTIVDTETTGFNRSKDAIVEVAAILYSLRLAAPVATYAELIPTTVRATQVTKGCTAEDVTGISSALLDEVPEGFSMLRTVVGKFLSISDVILAHNAAFDKGFIGDHPTFKGKQWVCTEYHVKWPKPSTSKSLINIALAHGVPVICAHRALTDCDIIARLLTKVHEMGHDIRALIDKAARPHVMVRALVDKANKDLASNAGFYWAKEFNQWRKEVAEEDLNAGLDLPFNVARC